MHEIFALEDVLNVLIELETLGNKHYTEMATLTEDYELKKFFELLAKQELAHKALYTSYKELHIAFESGGVTDEYKAYMDSLLKGTVKFLETSNEVKDFESGYNIAISLEKDTLLFLSELKQIIEKSYHEVIDNVMDQERGHLKALYDFKLRK
jgi:rubrerythrin